ncbi:hypothetical protein F4776DRAFT_302594 [Hypoxylon sp. NC0597]|nr:hypothetical protein F4776DRAFT_302594 [Hypoxylon sp. NC0597]
MGERKSTSNKRTHNIRRYSNPMIHLTNDGKKHRYWQPFPGITKRKTPIFTPPQVARGGQTLGNLPCASNEKCTILVKNANLPVISSSPMGRSKAPSRKHTSCTGLLLIWAEDSQWILREVDLSGRNDSRHERLDKYCHKD